MKRPTPLVDMPPEAVRRGAEAREGVGGGQQSGVLPDFVHRLLSSIKFHGRGSVITASPTLSDGSIFPILILRDTDGSLSVSTGHGQSFSRISRRSLKSARLAACKAFHRADRDSSIVGSA